MCVCICACVHIYIYIYIYRERERGRERDLGLHSVNIESMIVSLLPTGLSDSVSTLSSLCMCLSVLKKTKKQLCYQQRLHQKMTGVRDDSGA